MALEAASGNVPIPITIECIVGEKRVGRRTSDAGVGGTKTELFIDDKAFPRRWLVRRVLRTLSGQTAQEADRDFTSVWTSLSETGVRSSQFEGGLKNPPRCDI
ncbi:hypothetical protein EVAR_25556_1 [Eumeta japonica]|uniref:Uncharacterized protein n=1 Tax=Eumeta variegata TaxID=151549 RepID=A0A4C1Z706_EUMVA|nr:hypothetical protein EVAR_25556_1 [Eumeta japonica]